MGQLAIGVAGAVIGSFFGCPEIGFMIGSLVGGLLFPQKGKSQPIQDVRMQNSAYGKTIPWVYGLMRVAGNVIWAGQPHEYGVSGGGKGGKGSSQQGCTMSFAIGLCEGPITGIQRIWANGKLIYDVTNPADFEQLAGSNSMTTNWTLYLGDELQVADPVMESQLGVGNVPANRGLAYIVFNELDLYNYGNSLPSLSFEIVNTPNLQYVQACEVEFPNAPPWTGGANADAIPLQLNVNGSYGWWFDALTAATLTPYQITPYGPVQSGESLAFYGYWPCGGARVLDGQPGILLSNGDYWLPNGLKPLFNTGVLMGNASWPSNSSYVQKNGSIMWGTYLGLGSYPLWIYNMNTGQLQTSSANPGAWNILTATEDYFYAVDMSTGNPTSNWFCKFDYNLNLIAKMFQPSALPAGSGYGAWSSATVAYAVSDDQIYISNGAPTGGNMAVYQDGAFIRTNFPNSGSQGFQPINNMIYQNLYAEGYAQNAFSILVPSYDTGATTLETIINDVCTRAGLTSGQWDATACTQTVRGYQVTESSSARDALSALLQLYTVDVADTDGLLKFVPRGNAPVVTIPYSDIGVSASSSDEAAQDPLQRSIQQEFELPQSLAVTCYGAYNDYNMVTQYAFRTQTVSNYKSSVEAPVTMTDGDMLQCAQTLLKAAWIGSETFKFNTDLKYLYLEPTDVVNVTGRDGKNYTVRLSKCTYDAKGVLEWTAQLEVPQIYPLAGAVPAVAGGYAAGYVPQRVGYAGGTLLAVMDIPPLRTQDGTTPGLYIAMTGLKATWPGANADMSRDDSTFTAALSITRPCAMGLAQTTLGNFLGGNQPDELNSVTVALYDPATALASVTYANFMNNESVAYLGGEVLGFRNATLNSNGTYTLTGLLRGLLGTERFISTHKTGESFVFLDQTRIGRVGININDFGGELYFLTQTLAASATDSTVPVTESPSSGCIQPLSPVLFRAFETGSGSSGALNLSWIRRARVNAGWNDGTDVPLDESTEAYTITATAGGVQLWQYSFAQTFTAPVIPNAVWPSTTLTGGMTGVPFGSVTTGTVITLTVQQHSDQGILGVPASLTFTKT